MSYVRVFSLSGKDPSQSDTDAISWHDMAQQILSTCFQSLKSCPLLLSHIEIPILKWLPKYSIKNDLYGDINAGLLVFVLLIPQGMAYGALAGYKPIYGLYCATIPLYVYAVFGESLIFLFCDLFIL